MIAFLRQVPWPQRVLGLAGLLPFWLPVLLSIDPGIPVTSLLTAQKLYAAVILSFLGGVHWGMTVADSRISSWTRIGWSVTPSLIGWIGALLSGAQAITVLALGFAVAAGVDMNIFSGQALWYRRLRMVLSAGAIGALLVSLVGMQP
jgi:hypothetical protein